MDPESSKELKYLMSLCYYDPDETVFEEIFPTYEKTTKDNEKKTSSERVYSYLQKNIEYTPIQVVYIMKILSSSNIYNKDDMNRVYKKIINEEIDSLFDKIKDDSFSDKNELLSTILFLISEFSSEHNDQEEIEQLILKMEYLKSMGFERELYYCLLSRRSDDLLHAMANFESKKRLQITWPLDSEVMLKLCFSSNKHWLKEIVSHFSTLLEHHHEFPSHPDIITVKLWQLVLINLLNNTSQNVDLSLFVNKFDNFISFIGHESDNDFLCMYFNEIKREFNLIAFCNLNYKRKSFHCWNNIFCNNSALSTISQMCNLSQIDSFEMKQVLNANNKLLKKIDKNIDSTIKWDIMNYNAYCLITKVIDLICSNVGTVTNEGQSSSNINELKELISIITPVGYRIEIMHNIFTCLFIRYEYFSYEDNNVNQNVSSYFDCSYFDKQNVESLKTFSNCRGFICHQDLLNEIVVLLKDCVFDIFEQKMLSEDDENYDIYISELKTLESYISNAMWRWEFIKTAPFEKPNVIHLCDFYKDINDSSSENDSKSSELPVKRKKKFKKQRSKSIPEKRPLNKDKPKDFLHSINKPDYISSMLSSPSSLLALCLETNDFTNAYKITEIYDMSNTDAYMEVYFTEQFIAIVKRIKNMSIHFDNSLNVNQIEAVTGSSVMSTAVVSIVESFLSMQKFPYNSELSDMVETYPQFFPPQIYDYSNSSIIYLVDLLLSTGVNYDITCGILNVAEKKSQEIATNLDGNDSKNLHFVFFIRNMISLFCGAYDNDYHNIKNVGICDFLTNDKLPFVYKDYVIFVDNLRIISKFGKYLLGGVKKDRLETFTELLTKQRKLFLPSAICNSTSGVEIEIPEQDCCYLNYFLTYLHKLSHLMTLTEESINEDSHYEMNMDVLNISTHKIIGDLMSKNSSIDKIEFLCKKLGINLIHMIGLNHCPPIKCSFKKSESNTFCDLLKIDVDHLDEQESLPVTNLQKPNQNIATYVLINNWVIANILKKIHSDNTEHALQQSIDSRTKFLDIYLQMKRFDVLKELYFNNKALTALHYSYDRNILSALLMKTHKMGNYEQCLKIINALPEHMLSDIYLKDFKNTVLYKISQDSRIREHWSYLFSITNIDEKVEEIIENLTCWSYEGVIKILNFLTQHIDISGEDLKSQLLKWIDNIHVYQKISQIIGRDSWTDVYSLSNADPEYVLQLLLDADQFEISLQWSNFHEISYNMKNLILHNLIKQYPTTLPPNNLNTLIVDMPIQQSIALCKDMLMNLRNIDTLKTITKFLIQNSQEYLQFENVRIGIELISHIDLNERNFFWELITKPLLIIEQYLMNAKLNKLSRLLKLIRPLLKSDPLGDNLFYNMSLIGSAIISTNSVDALLRIYAAKALEFKSSKNNKLSAYYNQPKELLIQSIDSINQIGSGAFVIPEEVPNKDQWVADNFSNHCMVCKTTIFSILIRRHHCRRCGRLVCYSCSRRKMIIPGHYSDIKVRFCDECHKQILNKAEAETNHMSEFPPTTSVQSDSHSLEWCLTMNEKHNREVRKEFIYDFSPNVNLCLSIMKMHSINLSYPRFLLDRSSELSKAAANTEDGVLELVHMRRALLLSCAVLYARPIPTASASITDTALVHTEHQLAVTDALARLATNGCHNMMPQVDSINTHYIRELIKAEKWELALEMSTKFGMPQMGVLAAWGKACLKSGCFNLARQKFSICFKKNASVINPGNDNSDNQSFTESTISNTESYSDLSRFKNSPALLDEIIMLIESNSYYMNPQILKKTEIIKDQFDSLTYINKPETTEPPLNIIHALSTLQKIKQGDFTDFATNVQYVKILHKKHNHQNEKFEFKRKLEPFFYKECIYYLMTYGSHKALINFYLKYGDLSVALQYCQSHSVDKEIFTDIIFMTYLKNNTINNLLKTMFEIDSTWMMWTDYLLYACRVLEHTGSLQQLHSVQIGIGDYVRAAITCVALYTRPTQPPHVANLHVRNHYLAQARGHLQHVPRNMTKDSNQTQIRALHLQMDNASVEKHINTIMRQMEIITILYVNEMSGKLTEKMINNLMLSGIEENRSNQCSLPTLFGSQIEKMKLGALLLICGMDTREAFVYVSKLIKEYQLNASKLFIAATRELINYDRYEEIPLICELIQLVMPENSSKIIDDLVEASISMIVRRCDSRSQLFDEVAEMIIAKTENVSIKISCYIECRLLKTAYHLAIQNKRFNDLKRIMREAEKLGQIEVKNACLKKISALKL